jgi:hypothetical protein
MSATASTATSAAATRSAWFLTRPPRILKRCLLLSLSITGLLPPQVDGRDDCSADELYPESDIPLELIELLDNKASNWETDRHHCTCLKPDKALEGRRLYERVHQNRLHYYHLYKYLAHRSPTMKELNKVTRQLKTWELEMHGQNREEVLKCWRLHLGASNLTGMVISSVADELESRCEDTVYKVRSWLRELRRRITQSQPGKDNIIYKHLSLARDALIPFFEVSFFYIEKIKNLIYLYIFYKALSDMSDGHLTKYNFEFFLILFMFLGIVVTHLLFFWFSYIYAEDIFEVGHQKNKCEGHTMMKIMFKTISCLLSPLIPCYVLANHIYYESRHGLNRRHLQTAKDTKAAISNIKENREDQEPEDPQEQNVSIRSRVKLYKKILRLEMKALNYRKLYSYFRCWIRHCLQILFPLQGHFGRLRVGHTSGGDHPPHVRHRPRQQAYQPHHGQQEKSALIVNDYLYSWL